jgi:hypothetical protein
MLSIHSADFFGVGSKGDIAPENELDFSICSKGKDNNQNVPADYNGVKNRRNDITLPDRTAYD